MSHDGVTGIELAPLPNTARKLDKMHKKGMAVSMNRRKIAESWNHLGFLTGSTFCSRDQEREIQKDLHISSPLSRGKQKVELEVEVGAEMAGMNGTEYQKRQHFTKQDLQKFPRKYGIMLSTPA